MVIECDQEVSEEFIEWLAQREGIIKVTYLSLANGREENGKEYGA